MLPYLHILIRVENDGSLHALGAFTSKEKQLAYQKACGLEASQVRLDFYNGPFDEDIKVVYAGHRRWNMELFQLGGYFKSEGEAWAWGTQEGYVSVLRIDTTYQEETALEQEAIQRYAKLQRRWRLTSYEELIKREGADKARANIKLRFYEDALESFKPKTRRDLRALGAFIILMFCLPFAVFFFLDQGSDYGENLSSVSWLPNYASDISFYRSKQIQVFEFTVGIQDFRQWAQRRGMKVSRIIKKETISRYTAYIPNQSNPPSASELQTNSLSVEELQSWQNEVSVQLDSGLIAEGPENDMAIYDNQTKRAYYESLNNF